MIHYLSLAEVAEKLGLTLNTVKSYHRKGMLPPHDAEVGRNRGWLEETIDNWDHGRPGRGGSSTAHTDSPG
ncbi:helix-turn-helix transcriptional regulator [Nocardia otitidiscaviarum]|uniref:helix-turn-helix transcriptional regulator n=1 Tax=Nocardia otitidiscaviarum TaxID=1823 RepID=UPI0024563DEC|nr:helix-turn-helix domain-containing protein [Nocardia otitidiscaviarum]